jgi:hypothetical protein
MTDLACDDSRSVDVVHRAVHSLAPPACAPRAHPEGQGAGALLAHGEARTAPSRRAGSSRWR